MCGIYGDIISAAEKATEDFAKTEELLEYPEVQADKAYYLSVLSKYNELKSLKDKLAALKQTLRDEQGVSRLLSEFSDDAERELIYEEISSLKRGAAKLAAIISNALGCKHVVERAYCRFKFTALSSKPGASFCSLIKEYLLTHGVKIKDEKSEYSNKGFLSESSFIAEGEDVITRLSPLTGAHKVTVSGAKSEELCFAVTPLDEARETPDNDFKISITRSSGAGGQHINKVETAVRVTHIPTGLTVTCQDERSQLANKKRALETIKKRLKTLDEKTEKNRVEADIYAQYRKKNTPVSFDYDNSTMTDARLNGFTTPFPFADFQSYVDRLIALCR